MFSIINSPFCLLKNDGVIGGGSGHGLPPGLFVKLGKHDGGGGGGGTEPPPRVIGIGGGGGGIGDEFD